MSAASPIKGILFDKDGTLLDYDESWLPVNRELARIAAQGMSFSPTICFRPAAWIR